MRIVFMGSPGFAVSSLEYLLLDKYEVAAVYTQPDRPAGRGRSVIAPPVKEAALSRGLPVMQPESLKSEEAITQLTGFKPDVIVVCAYGQILTQSVLDIPPLQCVNVHFSLLPRYRGASPVAAAILTGDIFTGVSIQLMRVKLDTGPVLARAAVPISHQDNTGTLTGKLSLVGARLLTEALGGWLRQETVPQPQNEVEATYCSRITREEGNIDWHQSAVEIWRKIRAFNPWPGCYTTWRGKQLKIIEAVPLAEESGAGQVSALSGLEVGVGVGTGDGTLGLLKVQLEGKKNMSATEFIRGQRDFIGVVLPD